MPAKTRSLSTQNANVTLSSGNANCLLRRSKCKEYLELSIIIPLTAMSLVITISYGYQGLKFQLASNFKYLEEGDGVAGLAVLSSACSSRELWHRQQCNLHKAVKPRNCLKRSCQRGWEAYALGSSLLFLCCTSRVLPCLGCSYCNIFTCCSNSATKPFGQY